MNRLFVYDENNNTVWQSALREPILHPSENKSNVVPPFNAYSAPGDITSVINVLAPTLSPKFEILKFKQTIFHHLIIWCNLQYGP